jgi:hypothetical protein
MCFYLLVGIGNKEMVYLTRGLLPKEDGQGQA